MRLHQNGLAKLIEEAGELVQVAGKLVAYPDLQLNKTQLHPDGTNLRRRLEEEIADISAAILFVTEKLQLDKRDINDRVIVKLRRFVVWDNESEHLASCVHLGGIDPCRYCPVSKKP